MRTNDRFEPYPLTLDVPAPTDGPFFAAVGLALVFAGLVTHVAVSVVGALFALRGLVTWWREVLPVEHVEEVAVGDATHRTTVPTARGTVEHLVAGAGGHRVFIPSEIHPYAAGLKGGAVGAVAMAAVAVLFGVVFEHSPWYPINLLAAAALPQLATASVEQLRGFDALAFVVAAFCHVVLSLLVGLVYAVMLPMLPARSSAVFGAVIGPILWTGLVWASLDVLNPVLNARVSWTWFILSQVAYGVATGYVIARAGFVETMQTWPLAARAGLLTPGIAPEKEDE